MEEKEQITQEKENVATVDNEETKETEKTYTKQEFDSLFNTKVQERLAKKDRSILDKYGVASYEELDSKFSKFDELSSKNKELATTLAFKENNIVPERYDDIKAIFKGKGLELTKENLVSQLETHPEWLGEKKRDSSTSIEKVGSSKESSMSNDESEKNMASKLFGIKLS